MTSPKDKCPQGFELRYTINAANPSAEADRKKMRYSCDWIASYASIQDPAEFDALVRGSMAELSDTGNAPESVTFDSAMALSAQVRASLSPQP